MTYTSAHSTFVSLKSFGDLVIANSCLKRIDRPDRNMISQLIGSHLAELNEVLGCDWEVALLPARAPGVPAIFDVRKNGPLRALSSAIDLRRALKKADFKQETTFVFDNAGQRERFLASGRRILSLQKDAGNIYESYLSFFRQQSISFAPEMPAKDANGGGIGIFPGSRVARKNLSQALVRETLDICAASASNVTLYLLNGERPDLEETDIPHQIVPRNFKAMSDAIRGCDMVVGADSMPAHIAEAYGRPVFVLSPVENSYWLPLSSFRRRNWALFSDDSHIARLEEFIASQSHGFA